MAVWRKLIFAAMSVGIFTASAEAAITHVTHNLNLRAGPDTSYHPMAIIPAGAAIDVLDCGAVWCHVHWASHLGYVNGYYLSTHVTVEVAPLVHIVQEHHIVTHHVVPGPVVHHTVVHHHVVTPPCRYLFC